MHEILFDGRSLDGWSMAGPGNFAIVDGALESRGGMGLLWYTRRTFGDFRVELDWRVRTPRDNSGVFVRFPDPGGDPWAAVREGYEVQILEETDEAVSRTGAIYGFAAPRPVTGRPPGEWNHFSIQVLGQDYVVVLNGETVTEFTGDRARQGFVGLQNHDDASRVQFRDIQAEEIGPHSLDAVRESDTTVAPYGPPPGIAPY